MLIAPASRNRRIYINNKVQKKSSSYAAGIFLSSVPLGVGRDEWHATTRAHVTITVHNQLHPSLSISRGETSLSPPIPHASHSCVHPVCADAVSSVHTFDSKAPDWGWNGFVKRSKLFKFDSGFVVNGKLMVSANVTVEKDNAAPALTPGGFSVGDEVVWLGSVRWSDDGNDRVEMGMRGTVMGSKARAGFANDVVVQFGSDRSSGQPAEEHVVVDKASSFGRPASCPAGDVFEENGLLVGAELAGLSEVLVTGTSQSDGWRASKYHGQYVRNCSMREDVKRFHCGRCVYTCKETGASIHFQVTDTTPVWYVLLGDSWRALREANAVESTASTPVGIANWVHAKRDSYGTYGGSASDLQVTTAQLIQATNNATLSTAGRANVVLLAGSMPYDLHAQLRGAYRRLDWSPLSNGRYVYAHSSVDAPSSLSSLPAADASGYWMWSAAATDGSSKSCWYVGPRALTGSRKGLCISTCRTLGCVTSMSYHTRTKLHPRCSPILAQFAQHAAESFRPLLVPQAAHRGHGAGPRVCDGRVEGVG